ncbi:MAG: 3-phosphoshikimate 1-carboxyvinyltransferase [Pseudomonadota bacterium]|nr:3-phosphoshikimate 1-carboxyvinyltransferase [Pseudomonadota bacterium]
MTARPDKHSVEPIDRAFGAVCLPGSKSISNRALLLAALAGGTTALVNVLDADDTRVMLDSLIALGISYHRSGAELVIRGGDGRFPVRDARLFLANAGTAFRSLTAALAFSGGCYELDGVPRMRDRPIGDLVDSLNRLGARVAYLGQPGFPPLLLEPADRLLSDCVSIKANVSSQFLSGLLMSAPLIAPRHGLRIVPEGGLISEPYVELTLSLMKQFGVSVTQVANGYLVPRAAYRSPGRFVVEGDASSASYFLALGAVAGGPVRVEGVGRDSAQGDIRFADALADMGARVELGAHHIEVSGPSDKRLKAFDADCNHIPDAAMTLAMVALFADAPSMLRNIGSWRVKETDRIAAMAAELRKIGAEVDEGSDWIRITPPIQWREATIDTYDDHRMAMCFSLIAAAGVRVHIRDPQCVAKTFPDYFDRLAELVRR